MSEIDNFVIWCAGFFDGEGSVVIPHGVRKGAATPAQRDQYWLQVSLTQTVRAPLDDVRARFGGRVCLSKSATERTKGLWRWVADSKNASAFLQTVRPYLRVKGPAADLGMEFQRTMNFDNAWAVRREWERHAPNQPPYILERIRLKAALESFNRQDRS